MIPDNYQPYKILLDAYKVASNRTRNVFIILNIYTIILLVGYFNHRWSWVRHIENNTDFKYIAFQITNTKIYIEDLPILGGLALFIILLWFYYARRRERGIIKEISTLVQQESDKSKVRDVHIELSSSLIFNSIEDVDTNDNLFRSISINHLLKLLISLPLIILTIIVLHDFYESTMKYVKYKNLHQNYKQFVPGVNLTNEIPINNINFIDSRVPNESYLIVRGEKETIAYLVDNSSCTKVSNSRYNISKKYNVEKFEPNNDKNIIIFWYLIENGFYWEAIEIVIRWIIAILLILLNSKIIKLYKRLKSEDENYQKMIVKKMKEM